MDGSSLAKELLDLGLPVSQSAFVQRRYQIKPQAFANLFKDFTAKLPTPSSLPILAVDGSDVILPRNPVDKTTCIQTGPNHTPYNAIHVNSLYDLESGIYQDLRIQDKRENEERSMMASSSFCTSACVDG